MPALKLPEITIRHIIEAPPMGVWLYVFAGLFILLILSNISQSNRK